MELSLRTLQEAVSIRRQIDTLEGRLESVLGGAPARTTSTSDRRRMSAATRAEQAAVARARRARLKAGKEKRRTPTAKQKGGITPAGQKRLSQLMKARWAARRK